MDSGTEIGAQARKGPKVKPTILPYHRDPERHQVNVMFVHPVTGKTVRKRLVASKGLSEEEAIEWAGKEVQKLQRELAKARQAPTEEPEEKTRKSGQTMADLWERYETEVLSDPEKASPRTRITYEKLWRKIRGVVGKVRVSEWSKEHSKKLADKFKACSPRYSNQGACLVSALFRVAIEDGKLEDAPKLIRRKGRKKLKEPAHNPTDLARLLAAAREYGAENGEPLELLILLGIDAGLRPGEVAGLRWEDVDWANNQILIRNQRPQKGDPNQVQDPKYGELGRYTLPKRLRVALELHRGRGESRYVITSAKTGQPLYTDLVSDRVERIHQRAGLITKRAHFMRSCAASRLAHNQGVGATDAQGLLRHKNLSTTDAYLREIRGSDTSRRASAIIDMINDAESDNALATVGNDLAGDDKRLH